MVNDATAPGAGTLVVVEPPVEVPELLHPVEPADGAADYENRIRRLQQENTRRGHTTSPAGEHT